MVARSTKQVTSRKGLPCGSISGEISLPLKASDKLEDRVRERLTELLAAPHARFALTSLGSKLTDIIGPRGSHLKAAGYGKLTDLLKELVGFSLEIARIVVESQQLSTLIDYAAAAPFASDFLEAAVAIEDKSMGIWRWPMTLRNWRSATSSPEPTQRSM